MVWYRPLARRIVNPSPQVRGSATLASLCDIPATFWCLQDSQFASFTLCEVASFCARHLSTLAYSLHRCPFVPFVPGALRAWHLSAWCLVPFVPGTCLLGVCTVPFVPGTCLLRRRSLFQKSARAKPIVVISLRHQSSGQFLVAPREGFRMVCDGSYSKGSNTRTWFDSERGCS
jgi:hypothetical protein